jgi:thiol-disulfide isomerase/thioredoxin
MLYLKWLTGLSLLVIAAQIAAGADSKPAEELARVIKEAAAASEELSRLVRTNGANANEAYGRYCQQMGALARRALALAEAYPHSAEAPEALVWTIGHSGSDQGTDDARDAAYDRLAERYLDSESLVSFVGRAWPDAQTTPHAEAFLRAVVERCPNPRVKALACFDLARHQHELFEIRQLFDAPSRGKAVESRFRPEIVRRIRAVSPAELRREAEWLYERTLKEFADFRPNGDAFPSLGEKAEGGLFRLRYLAIGCRAPEIAGADIDGRPMTLSESRGKVVLLSFWASWCGPCMALLPEEKALVERMKGRPFALLGVNGDQDREKAKTIAAQAGFPGRSFWDGGSEAGISARWGVNRWPTVYLIDARGMIRDRGILHEELERSVEALVAETEAPAIRP